MHVNRIILFYYKLQEVSNGHGNNKAGLLEKI